MRLEDYIVRNDILMESTFQELLKKIANKPMNILRKLFKDNWMKLVNELKRKELENDALQIINKHFQTKYKSLDEITISKIEELPIHEDFAHYWELIKQEAFPTLAFWPALRCWLEIDKLISGSNANVSSLIIYGIFWVLLVSGKYAKSWDKWRKENPKEYSKEKGKERSVGFV